MMNKIIIILLAIVSLFTGCISDGISGNYVLNNYSNIVINNDGTFQQHGIKYHLPFAVEGLYSIDNSENITLHYSYGYFAVFTKTEIGLRDNNGAIYEKQK